MFLYEYIFAKSLQECVNSLCINIFAEIQNVLSKKNKRRRNTGLFGWEITNVIYINVDIGEFFPFQIFDSFAFCSK